MLQHNFLSHFRHIRAARYLTTAYFVETGGSCTEHCSGMGRHWTAAPVRRRCDADKNFFLRYTDIFVGTPCIEEEYVTNTITPQQCRLRDITYAAPITVNLEYTRGKEIVTKRGRDGEGAVTIGKIPLMLRCQNCVLHGKSEAELAQLGECPLDPGGYFIIR